MMNSSRKKKAALLLSFSVHFGDKGGRTMRTGRTDHHKLLLLYFLSLLLFTQFLLTFAAQQCDVTTAVGDPVTIELQYSGFTQDNELIWKHGDTKVFEKRKGTVIIGSKENVTSGGSLILHSVQMDQKGAYSAEVYDSTTGKELHKAVKNLCVTAEGSSVGPIVGGVVGGVLVTVLAAGALIYWKKRHPQENCKAQQNTTRGREEQSLKDNN